jgi:hypothetical protein
MLVIVRETPRPVSAEIGDKNLVASRDGHDLVRMRTFLAGSVGARTVELQHSVGRLIKEIWGRAGQRNSHGRPGVVLLILGHSTTIKRAVIRGSARACHSRVKM